MYEDKLDGRITSEQFDRKAKETRSKQQTLRAKISQHQSTAVDLRSGFNMMKLTSIACRDFERQMAREQRKLLELVVNGAMWKEGRLKVTLHEPFQTLARSNSASATKNGAKGTSEPKLSELAPRHGFEPRFTAPKAAVLPLDDRGISKRKEYYLPV